MDLKQLDVLVAERVMEWEKIVVPLPGFQVPMWKRLNERTITLVDMPAFSSDIVAAWQVVERIKTTPRPEKTYKGACVRVSVTESATGAACSMEIWGWGYKAKAQTTPLAICLAALKAKGVEVPEE